jgi:hypothetical protein
MTTAGAGAYLTRRHQGPHRTRVICPHPNIITVDEAGEVVRRTMAVRDDRSAVVRDGRVGRQAGAEDLDLVIGGAELAVQLSELVGVLGGAALGRGGELGAEPVDNLGVLGCGPLLGVAGVAADPVEFGLVLGVQCGQRGVAGGQLGAVDAWSADRGRRRRGPAAHRSGASRCCPSRASSWCPVALPWNGSKPRSFHAVASCDHGPSVSAGHAWSGDGNRIRVARLEGSGVGTLPRFYQHHQSPHSLL